MPFACSVTYISRDSTANTFTTYKSSSSSYGAATGAYAVGQTTQYTDTVTTESGTFANAGGGNTSGSNATEVERAFATGGTTFRGEGATSGTDGTYITSTSQSYSEIRSYSYTFGNRTEGKTELTTAIIPNAGTYSEFTVSRKTTVSHFSESYDTSVSLLFTCQTTDPTATVITLYRWTITGRIDATSSDGTGGATTDGTTIELDSFSATRYFPIKTTIQDLALPFCLATTKSTTLTSYYNWTSETLSQTYVDIALDNSKGIISSVPMFTQVTTSDLELICYPEYKKETSVFHVMGEWDIYGLDVATIRFSSGDNIYHSNYDLFLGGSSTYTYSSVDFLVTGTASGTINSTRTTISLTYASIDNEGTNTTSIIRTEFYPEELTGDRDPEFIKAVFKTSTTTQEISTTKYVQTTSEYFFGDESIITDSSLADIRWTYTTPALMVTTSVFQKYHNYYTSTKTDSISDFVYKLTTYNGLIASPFIDKSGTSSTSSSDSYSTQEQGDTFTYSASGASGFTNSDGSTEKIGPYGKNLNTILATFNTNFYSGMNYTSETITIPAGIFLKTSGTSGYFSFSPSSATWAIFKMPKPEDSGTIDNLDGLLPSVYVIPYSGSATSISSTSSTTIFQVFSTSSGSPINISQTIRYKTNNSISTQTRTAAFELGGGQTFLVTNQSVLNFDTYFATNTGGYVYPIAGDMFFTSGRLVSSRSYNIQGALINNYSTASNLSIIVKETSDSFTHPVSFYRDYAWPKISLRSAILRSGMSGAIIPSSPSFAPFFGNAFSLASVT